VTRLEVEAAVQRRHRRHEQRHRAARLQQLQRGAQLGHVVEDVFEHADVHHRVEAAAAVGEQRLRGDLAHLDARHRRSALSELGEHVVGRLDRQHVVACRGQLGGDRPDTGADLQHASAKVRPQLVADPREEAIGVGQVGQLFGRTEHRLAAGRLCPQARAALRPQRLVAAHLLADRLHPAADRQQVAGELAEVAALYVAGARVPRPERDRHLVHRKAVCLHDCHHRAEEPVRLGGQRLLQQRPHRVGVVHPEAGGAVADAAGTGDGLDRGVAQPAERGAHEAGAGRRAAPRPTRADREAAAVREVAAHERGDLARVVLAVGVERHDHVGAVGQRGAEAAQ